MIKDYLRLARISIASITGLAPVMGAIAVGRYHPFTLFLLFLIGFFGHIYGMTHNDIIDYKIDKKALEVSNRPLVTGSISIKKAWIFGLICLFLMFVIAIINSLLTSHFSPIIILFIPMLCVTIYNIYSKQIPFADILLAFGIFFFILYGAYSQYVDINRLPKLVWIICFLGTIQMLSINMIAGGYKDIKTDERHGAKTGAMILGLNIKKNKIYMNKSFKFITYALQFLNIGIAYLPFIIIPNFASPLLLKYIIFSLLAILSIITILITCKYLALKYFERGKIRMLFNLQGYINFMFAPILLISVSPYAFFIIFIPGIDFFITNLIFHEKFMQPSNM